MTRWNSLRQADVFDHQNTTDTLVVGAAALF